MDDPATLLEEGFHAVVVAAGLTVPLALGVPGEDAAVRGLDLLRDPSHHRFAGHAVVVGGGATAVDCAVTALERGARSVELIALETWAEMPLDATARAEVLSAGVAVTGRTRIRRIRVHGGRIAGLDTERVALPPDRPFHPSSVVGVRGSAAFRPDVDHVIVAIGARCSVAWPDHPLVVPAGDARNGPTYVVSAVASGKNAAEEVDALLAGQPRPIVPRHTHGPGRLPGWRAIPVPLDTRFFGRPIRSPFLLSAGPPTDGYQQMQRAYEAGWSGGVLKTAFDGGSVHIPGACMFRFPGDTWGNCDNVSDHPLDRACEEIARLVEAWPDRLTIGSTGGPITGDDERDRAAWVSNTRKLEDAGAMAIEYSLSCPQGGDGTEGDIVSQNARLTAKIVEWILEAGRPGVPKLFKLTAAVTSIAAIGKAIEEVLGRHPGAAAGVTLANTFPGLTFRWGDKPEWEEGIVVGLSGAGIAPVTNLTLASVAHLGVPVSGNGGAMDHHTAARFLALGAETVQFCSVILKYGLSVVDDLHSGLSHLMADRGIPDVATLVGRALPRPIRAFPDLSAEKRISTCDPDLCLRCGNCVRCPYLAIVLDVDRRPVTDPARCTGCGLCTLQCFAGALSLRERTAVDRAALAGA